MIQLYFTKFTLPNDSSHLEYDARENRSEVEQKKVGGGVVVPQIDERQVVVGAVEEGRDEVQAAELCIRAPLLDKWKFVCTYVHTYVYKYHTMSC